MKTTDPARYFRNAASPAARLARWQEPSFHRPNFRAGIEPLSAIDSRPAGKRRKRRIYFVMQSVENKRADN